MSKINDSSQRPLLIDLDGVLRLGKSPAEGLKEFFEFLVLSKSQVCILSNSTFTTSVDIKKFFESNSVLCPFPIMTAAEAAYEYVAARYKKVTVYADPSIKALFDEFLSDENPEAVVVGHLGKNWSYEILNDIFLKVFSGAKLIAMHKNRYWHTPEDGYAINAGAFITAIEYAASAEAVLIGKPSPVFFNTALNKIGVHEGEEFIMIGDDLEVDIKAAQNAGGKAVLIYTGKTKNPYPREKNITPDYEAMNLTEAIELLKDIG